MATSSLSVPEKLETAQLVKVPKWIASTWRKLPSDSVVGFLSETPNKQTPTYHLFGDPMDEQILSHSELSCFDASKRPEKRLLVFRGDSYDDDEEELRTESVVFQVDEVLTMMPELTTSYRSALRHRGLSRVHQYHPTILTDPPNGISAVNCQTPLDRRFLRLKATTTPFTTEKMFSQLNTISSITSNILPYTQATFRPSADPPAKGKMVFLTEDELRKRLFEIFEISGKNSLTMKELMRCTGKSQRTLVKQLESIAVQGVDPEARNSSAWSLKLEYTIPSRRIPTAKSASMMVEPRSTKRPRII